ncbi:MAG: methionyl-tRNA formyltransferase [Candidatus Limnocylindria bacterium]
MFLGTPEFALPSLDALKRLHDGGRVEIVAVVTQPDRPGHRRRLAVPPVKARAAVHGLRVLQPARLAAGALEELLALRPALLVWAAYGNLIPARLIAAAGGRAVNVHASLLPRHRGAAPVAGAILAGDRETGVTLMEGTAVLDAGPILAQERVRIVPDEDAGALTARLATLGAALLERQLPAYLDGGIAPRPQDDTEATWAPKLAAADGQLDFTSPADALARRVRALWPVPGAFTTFRGQRLGIEKASVAAGPPREHGTLEIRDGAPRVAAGAGWLRLDAVRPAGRRAMSGADWARGVRGLGEEDRLPS